MACTARRLARLHRTTTAPPPVRPPRLRTTVVTPLVPPRTVPRVAEATHPRHLTRVRMVEAALTAALRAAEAGNIK